MSNDILNTCRELAYTVASELAGRPLYVVAADSLKGLPPVQCCYGWASEQLFAIRPYVEWHGPGPLIVLDIAAIAEDAKSGMLESCCACIMCHELAHVLPAKPSQLLECSPNRLRHEFAGLKKFSTSAPLPPAKDAAHDMAFLRGACHVWHRAVAAGFEPAWSKLLRWPFYSWSYLEILQAEAKELAGKSFSEIEEIPPPQRLLDVWNSDLSRFEKHEELYASRNQ